MTDTAPALKTMFKLIKRKFLKEILTIDGQPMDVDWRLEPDQLEDELYRKFAALHNSDQKRFAHILHVNPFPKEVEQFDAEGQFKLQLDKNAEGFTIVHHKGEDGESFLRIKCAFNSSQKKRILELFAKYMLATEICDKPPEEYPIRELNPRYARGFAMKVPDPMVKEARVYSVSLEIVNPIDGFVDELLHKCETGDLFERLEHSCKDFPVEWRSPMAWEFDITLFLDKTNIIQTTITGKDEVIREPKTKKYRVRVTETNVTISNCQDDAYKQLIMDTLAANGIRNVFKKEILSREYRK